MPDSAPLPSGPPLRISSGGGLSSLQEPYHQGLALGSAFTQMGVSLAGTGQGSSLEASFPTSIGQPMPGMGQPIPGMTAGMGIGQSMPMIHFMQQHGGVLPQQHPPTPPEIYGLQLVMAQAQQHPTALEVYLSQDRLQDSLTSQRVREMQMQALGLQLMQASPIQFPSHLQLHAQMLSNATQARSASEAQPEGTANRPGQLQG